jgi:hypothetical protein
LDLTEEYAAIAPAGRPAQRKSIRESPMRKGLKADERIPFERLFFDEQYGHRPFAVCNQL